MDEHQADLDAWLHYDNYPRPYQGYRNIGRCSIETVKLFLNPVKKET